VGSASKEAAGFKDEPPPIKGGKAWHPWGEYADELRANPGKWKQLTTDDMQSLAISITNGSNSALNSSLGFQITTRNNRVDEDGRRRCDIWARYNPEHDKSEEQG
jgi:hypothetical protein